MTPQHAISSAVSPAPPVLNCDLAEKFIGLFKPNRYKVRWGGRGGAKSWSFARALIVKSYQKKLLVGCFREFQNSIKDSVHRLISQQIDEMHLTPWFEVTEKSIRCILTGSEFIFKGLRHNVTEIKSLEGLDIAWVEEAQLVSKESWELLIPTVRKDGSEIWVSYNPIEETDDTHQRFVINTPPDADVQLVNYCDNPWFPPPLELERKYMLQRDPESYDHVWLGKCRQISQAVIFKKRYIVHNFDTPEMFADGSRPQFHHGLDFGFADDPLAFMRMFITGTPPDEELWIDREVYGHHIELDELDARRGDKGEKLPGYLDQIETARRWPILADGSRPETISYLAKRGFNIKAAQKWSGSVEDGITHLKTFKMIHIHENNCPHQAIEARLYKWKVDKNTGMILPEPVDANNHCWDADRYALDGIIHKRGVANIWSKL